MRSLIIEGSGYEGTLWGLETGVPTLRVRFVTNKADDSVQFPVGLAPD